MRNRPKIRWLMCPNCHEETLVTRPACLSNSNPVYAKCDHCDGGIYQAEIARQIDEAAAKGAK